MDSEIYIKACDLAKAIAESPEAVELKRAEQEIRKDKVANNLTERWKKVYERVTELQKNGQPLSEQDERSIEFIEAKVENHPLLLEFIDAHHKFTAMLEEINEVLTGALTFDTEEETDPCLTCPSKGGCSADAASCSIKN
jgi:cell fate (sporulation/competence/biofilm development) regulator YlbF (YheA/YmcA/DUF963 family)